MRNMRDDGWTTDEKNTSSNIYHSLARNSASLAPEFAPLRQSTNPVLQRLSINARLHPRLQIFGKLSPICRTMCTFITATILSIKEFAKKTCKHEKILAESDLI